MTLRRSAAALVMTLAAFVAAVAQEPQEIDQEAMMSLSFWEFDQTMGGGWRFVADQGRHEEAARLIESYLEHNDERLEGGMKGYLHFHCSQLWILAEDEERGLGHLAVATVDSFPERFPRSWNFMVRGTEAFVRGEFDLLTASRLELSEMPGLSARDSNFLQALEFMETQEDVPYADILRGWLEDSPH